MALLEPLDADVRTLHIRCGSDIQHKLSDAGFVGDFLEHSYPYVAGPVQDGPGSLERRAAFIADHYGVAQALAEVEAAERALFESAAYGRVVIWSEHDAYDQLVLVRLLAHYAMHARPAVLELITIDRWPGIERFIGLGQLPPEALRSLWPSRVLARLVARMTWETDPLPGQGDLQIRDRILPLAEGPEPLVQGTGSWTEPMQLTEVGRAVRRGQRDYHAFPRAARWVGGVEIVGGTATWRWDEAQRDVRFTRPPRGA